MFLPSISDCRSGCHGTVLWSVLSFLKGLSSRGPRGDCVKLIVSRILHLSVSDTVDLLSVLSLPSFKRRTDSYKPSQETVTVNAHWVSPVLGAGQQLKKY